MSAPDRRALLDRDHGKLSIRRQCTLLRVARSGVYRPPRPANDDDLSLMRRIDELFTAWPFLGSRRMAAMLRADGYGINRKHVQRLMRRMGIAALGPKPRTTKPAPGHKIFPYLLRGLAIDRPNQVWAADISAPRRRGGCDELDRDLLACWLLTDRCDAVRSGREPGSKGSVRSRRVPPARGNAHRLNCTGRRHHRRAGLPLVPWRDNEACAGSLCIEQPKLP
jgi:hypothetical protein